MGAGPHGRPSGGFVRSPRNTTILGAVTQREQALVVPDFGGDVRSEVLELAAGYGVARVEEQLDGGGTAGVSVTGVHRQLQPEGALAKQLPETALAGGGDWNLRFGDGTYSLTGHAGLSHVSGSREVMDRLQRSSVRFFQRPDQDHVSLDSTRTSLTGWSAGLGLRRRSGEHWLWDVDVEAESPGFAINDLGRLRTADHLSARGGLTYRETEPSPGPDARRRRGARRLARALRGARRAGAHGQDVLLAPALKERPGPPGHPGRAGGPPPLRASTP